MNGFFMYGIVVPYDKYLELDTGISIEEVIIDTDEIQGIYTGRDNDFVVIGRVLREVTKDTENPHEIPLIESFVEYGIREEVKKKYKISGEAHYYYITK